MLLMLSSKYFLLDNFENQMHMVIPSVHSLPFLIYCFFSCSGLGDKDDNGETAPAGGRGSADNQDVVLRVRRTQSFIEDDK